MKKSQKFKELDLKQASQKRMEIAKELTKAKLSMDPGVVDYEGGISAAQSDFKLVNRRIAILKNTQGEK